MKSAAVTPFTAFALVLTLTSCGQNQADADQQSEAAASQLVEGITIANQRMMLAPVSGNPAAVYFELTYVGDAPVTLDGVSVDGAQSAAIHQMGEDGNGGMMTASGPLTLKSGETLELKPGGFHVMAMQVSPKLQAGQSTNVTITLSDGSAHSFETDVKSAGDER
ncbi:MAG: copper chaperone PCu(A)C [Erythrobacter sp.]|uniref:copper chaperone PCu(A)C n=1 Tax=Erythrobacter sp. TaxID=1042 RepID=UPI00329A08A4